MRYSKPYFYDEFQCIADQCPDTCCAGWQIVIDDESLKRYASQQGDFGERLNRSIDWAEDIFLQHHKRCSFLNEENLCDIYKELGKDALCHTCQTYPRHIEEYEGLRELSLSLSCPIAARKIIEEENPLTFIETEDEKEEELIDEFEDFDYLLFTQLEDARAVILSILQNRDNSIDTRMSLVLSMANEIDICIVEERYFDVDEVIQIWKESDVQIRVECQIDHNWNLEHRYDKLCEQFEVFHQLERLREEWTDTLEDTWSMLYKEGQDHYNEVYKRFHETYGNNSPYVKKWEVISENIMVFFVFTYFCGAVYDDWIYSKMAMAVFSTVFIQEFIMARWVMQDEQITIEDCVELAYRYAREIEHSDENLNMLEEWFQKPREEKI